MGTPAQLNGSIWQNKTFRKMFTAYSISSFGDWFDIIAISVLLAYTWQTEPIWIAMVPVMYALPGILLGSFAGVLADRTKKVKVMIIADLLVSLLTIGLMFAPNIYWVLPVLALRAALGVFNVPAQQALTRNVVAEEHLLKATSYNGLVNQASKIAGPLLGSAALAVVSPQMCLLINALTRLISVLLLLTIRNLAEDQPLQDQGEGKPSFREQWQEGWAFLYQNKLILNTFAFTLFGILAILLIDFQFAVLFRDLIPDNPAVIGWAMSASGVGAVVGMTWMNRLQNIRYGLSLTGAYVLMGLGFAFQGLYESGMSIGWVLLYAMLVGLGNGIFMVAFQFILQKETPKDMVGRIFGIQNTVISTVVIAAPLLGGTLVQLFGASVIYLGVGIGVTVIGLIGFLFRRLLWPQSATVGSAEKPLPVGN